MTVAAFALYFIYGVIGSLSAFLLEKRDNSLRIAAFVIMSYVNNILLVVFASILWKQNSRFGHIL